MSRVVSIIRGLVSDTHLPTVPVVEAVVVNRDDKFHIVPRVWRDEASGDVTFFNPASCDLAGDAYAYKSCRDAFERATEWANDRALEIVTPPTITATLAFKFGGETHEIRRGYSSEDEMLADIADLSKQPTHHDDPVLLHTSFTAALAH